ncbi:ABC transporter ATP-binding protein [Rhizobium sp. YS-1r]|uniref:ABC transporter ATP-binding protein n=1 Tax=Neorhizobium phenanthreniclasticum TaxID=3157917 RepID=A0ABV0LWD4_9HYPH|nr:ABC transporter ATP-binding protein [Rhizobium sp. YS-1r]
MSHALVLENVRVSRGGAEIIKGVSAEFPAAGITAICGPNGAGKSTLMAAAANLLPHDGKTTFNGRRPNATELSFMPQALGLRAQLSVLEVVLLGRLDKLGWSLRPADIDAADAAMAAVGITEFAARRVDTLSGGQQQLVLLAQRLIRRPEILLLDEPTSALDLRRQLLVLDILKTYAEENGAVVAVVLHDLSLAARYSSNLLILHEGRSACLGHPSHVLDEPLIRSVYGVDAEILFTSGGTPVIAPLSPSETPRTKSLDKFPYRQETNGLRST